MVRFDIAALLDELSNQEAFLGLFLLGAGLVFMILGSQMFKPLLGISLGVVGFVIGGLLPLHDMTRWLSSFGLATALAVIGLYYYRMALAVLCGSWAGLAVIAFLSPFELRYELVLILAGIACTVAVSLTSIMHDESLAWVTSLEGAILGLSGLVVFAGHSGNAWNHMRRLLVQTPLFVPFLVLAVTVTGFYLQMSLMRQKQSGT